MPIIIDYPRVPARAGELGFRSVYYNSGAFAFADEAPAGIVGWIGPDDATIRADLPATLVRVAAPFEANLSKKLTTIWPAWIDGPAWVLPKSHWSFELTHGSAAWLTTALNQAGIDPAALRSRTDAAAIEFTPDEADRLQSLVESLLTHLQSSDFALLFPHQPHLATIHHHKQIWWQTRDTELTERLAR